MPPQSANFRMHNIVERPIAPWMRPLNAPIMYVALSYDHRIIDGKVCRVLVAVKRLGRIRKKLLLDNIRKKGVRL